MTNKKIGFISDVHLEFGDLDLVNQDNIDILILDGDVSVPHSWKHNHSSGARKNAEKQQNFFTRIGERFPLSLYIPGNHEHYLGEVTLTDQILQSAMPSNIKVGKALLHEEDDFVIIANTLWTDFDKGNPNAFIQCNMGMNDFRICTFNGSRFLAQDAWKEHVIAVDFIKENLKKFPNKKKIVVSHHAPSYKSINQKYVGDVLNAAYASSLENIMLDYGVDTWIHGHMHDPVDYKIGDTRVVSNPRGYLHREKTVEQDKNYSYKLVES